MTKNVVGGRHLHKSTEHYTPLGIVDRARKVLGGVLDLDPASSALANQHVRANRFYGPDGGEVADGLSVPWVANTIFLNPPGGKTPEGKSLPAAFWERLVEAYANGSECIFIGFSLEQLQVFQNQVSPEYGTPTDFPLCFPSKRIAYNCPEENGWGVRKGASPPHASYIAYLGSDVDLFISTFKDIGKFTIPRPNYKPKEK